MADFNSDAVVSTAWLAEHLRAPDVHVVDASYYLPHEGLSGRQEFELQHIPGAVFFDIDDIADSNDPLPHMLPAPEKFSSKVRRLGLGDGVRMVDQQPRTGAHNTLVAFMHPKASGGVLTELVQEMGHE